jgi:hypothetical protein
MVLYYLLAHIKQQAIVNVVNAQHSNYNNRVDYNVSVAFYVAEQEH